MGWELGVGGIGLLMAMSLALGVAVQLVLSRATTHWMSAIGAFASFVSGLVVREMWFGRATEKARSRTSMHLLQWAPLIPTLMELAAVIEAWQLERRIRRIATADRVARHVAQSARDRNGRSRGNARLLQPD